MWKKLDFIVKFLTKFVKKKRIMFVLLVPMFTNLCNTYLWQSVGSSLKHKPAQAKKFELAWLGSVTIIFFSQAHLGLKSKLKYPSWDLLGLGMKWYFWAIFSPGSDINQGSTYARAWALKYFWLAKPCSIHPGWRESSFNLSFNRMKDNCM